MMRESEESLDEWFLRESIERAKAGEREAAIDVIRMAVVGLNANNLSDELAYYLAQALQDVLLDPTGNSFIKAFNLRQDAWRPAAESAKHRSLRAALWVHFAAQRGMSLSEAKAQASDLWGFANIDRELRKHTVTAVDDGTDLWDEIFKAEGKPLPSRP